MYKNAGVYSVNQAQTGSLTDHDFSDTCCVTGSLHRRHLVDS